MNEFFRVILAPMLSIMFLITLSCTEPKTPKDSFEQGQATGIPEIDLLTNDLEKKPDNIATLKKRCEAYTKYNYFKEAVSDAELVLSKDSTNWEHFRLLAWAYVENQQSRPAIKVLEKATRFFPKNISVRLVQAEVNITIKQYQDALLASEKVLELQAMHPEGLFMRGMVKKYTGDTLGAIDDFQSVAEQDSDHKDAYSQLGYIFLTLQNPECVQFFNNALRVDSMAIDALEGIARYYHYSNNYDEAITAYKNLMIRHPQHHEPPFNFGIMHMELDSFKQAHYYFDIAVKLDPIFGDAYFYRGLAAEQLKRYKEALSDFKHAVKFNEKTGNGEAAYKRVKSIIESNK